MNSRQRRRRAAARARAHEQRVVTSVTDTVPCSHGHNLRHKVRLDVDENGVIVHMQSECTVDPPTREEVAVTRGLLGDDVYKSCAAVVAGIRAYVPRMRRNVARLTRDIDTLGNPVMMGSNPVLHRVIERCHDAAIEIGEQREANEPIKPDVEPEFMRIQTRRNALAALLSGVPRPAAWRIALDYETDMESRGYKRRIFLSVNFERLTKRLRIAKYVGRGRFMMLPDLQKLLTAEREYITVGKDGRVACTVCGTRIRSLSSHLKSKRHQAKVETSVFDLCEAIGARLQHRHWKPENKQ